jgi:hypothetical protein
METLQAFGALFQILQYYRKFLYYKRKMLCNYVINIFKVSSFIPFCSDFLSTTSVDFLLSHGSHGL